MMPVLITKNFFLSYFDEVNAKLKFILILCIFRTCDAKFFLTAFQNRSALQKM